jgi:TolA-binding protein
LGQITAAKKTLKELIAAYPSAEVTPSAQKRLKVLESIK